MLRVKTLVLLFVLYVFVAKAEARQVTVSVPSLAMSQAAFYVANEKGFYNEEGLQVQLILMTARVANLALIGGDVDFSAGGMSGLTAAVRGTPMRILFTGFIRPMHWLYAAPAIRDLRSLKNKKIGIDGFGGAMDVLLKEILSANNMSRDVTTLGVGVLSTRYMALVNGVVDATLLTFPFNFMAEEAGYRELVSFIRQDLIQLAGNIVVREQLLQSDPGLVEAFTRATVKGLIYTRDNRSGTIPILARSLKIKENAAASMYDLARPAMTADGTLTPQMQLKALQLILKSQESKESPSLDKLFDYSLVRKTTSELEAKGWRPRP